MFWLFGRVHAGGARVLAGGPEDGFLGTWILVENENWEAILDHLGLGTLTRMAALNLKPSVIFERCFCLCVCVCVCVSRRNSCCHIIDA